MKPTFTLDTREFNAVLKRTAEQSSRAGVDVVNGRLFAVVLKAIRLTEKANKEKIASDLGQTGTELKYTRAGGLRKGKRAKGRMILREDSFAARIVNARLRDRVGPGAMLHGDELQAAARKLIQARMRSVAFIKSGWVWSLRALLPFVKFGRKGNPDRDAKAVGRPKGTAEPAKLALFKPMVGTATNTALIAGGGKFQAEGAHNPMPVAMAGLQKALAGEQAEMERHLREKLMAASRKAGARVR